MSVWLASGCLRSLVALVVHCFAFASRVKYEADFMTDLFQCPLQFVNSGNGNILILRIFYIRIFKCAFYKESIYR